MSSEELAAVMLDARVDRLEAALTHLVEAQARTEGNLATLTERVDRLGEQMATLTEVVDRLAEAQTRTEGNLAALTERIDRLGEQMATLTEVVDRLGEQMATLTERVDRLGEQMATLADRVDRLTVVVGTLRGESLERRYRERAPAYFEDILGRIHALSSEELAALLDEAQARGALSREDRRDLLHADVVIRGRRWDDGSQVYLVVEVSGVVDEHDVVRAARRAVLLRQATGTPTLAAVAGENITVPAEDAAIIREVWRVRDGKAKSPTD